MSKKLIMVDNFTREIVIHRLEVEVSGGCQEHIYRARFWMGPGDTPTWTSSMVKVVRFVCVLVQVTRVIGARDIPHFHSDIVNVFLSGIDVKSQLAQTQRMGAKYYKEFVSRISHNHEGLIYREVGRWPGVDAHCSRGKAAKSVLGEQRE